MKFCISAIDCKFNLFTILDIPEDTWNTIDLNAKNLEKEVIRLSETLKIHPAIVASRIRYEKNNYRLLTQFIGKDQIQHE